MRFFSLALMAATDKDSSLISTPTTLPSKPTCSASQQEIFPGPQPTSRTLIPGRNPEFIKKARVEGPYISSEIARRSSSCLPTSNVYAGKLCFVLASFEQSFGVNIMFSALSFLILRII